MKLKWDKYSDQPEVIKDRALKKQIYKEVRWDSFKMLVTNLVVYPICLLFYYLSPSKEIAQDNNTFFGMSINLDKNPEATKALIEDLGVKNLLIRMPLHDIENLQSYVAFAEEYQDRNILINILQDRRHVEDHELLKQSLDKIFDAFQHVSSRFQIGNAVNRKKWVIFSMGEYLQFYKVAFDLRNEKFPNLVLLGSSIIDFEYYFTIQTLFNFQKVHFDQCSTLLYVDRRGAPENAQMGFDLSKKLKLLQAITRMSSKTGSEIVITETNWPITQTHPYAPTSENDCVTLEEHADFLVRYYLLALATGVVKNVYWHQLIAPGYGLIDNRNDELIKYPAYQAFKVMLAFLQGANFQKMTRDNEMYRLTLLKDDRQIEVVWALIEQEITIENQQVFSRDGDDITCKKQLITGSPIYLVSKNNL